MARVYTARPTERSPPEPNDLLLVPTALHQRACHILVGDGLDLPDEEFDYEDFVAREFGHRTSKAIRIRWYWVVTAVVVAVTLLTLVLAGVW